MAQAPYQQKLYPLFFAFFLLSLPGRLLLLISFLHSRRPYTRNIEAFLKRLLLRTAKIWHFFSNLGGMQ